jgi:hypothetical protein
MTVGADRTDGDQQREATRRRRLAMVVRVSMIAVLGAMALWLVLELDKARRAQNCLESGGRKCRVIEAN